MSKAHDELRARAEMLYNRYGTPFHSGRYSCNDRLYRLLRDYEAGRLPPEVVAQFEELDWWTWTRPAKPPGRNEREVAALEHWVAATGERDLSKVEVNRGGVGPDGQTLLVGTTLTRLGELAGVRELSKAHHARLDALFGPGWHVGWTRRARDARKPRHLR